MDIIKAVDCKVGYAYKIKSRNLTIGVFRKAKFSDRFENGFVGIREKFGNLFLFTEYHRDDGPPYGTVSPYEEIEKCPISDLREHFDTICHKCNGKVDFVKNDRHGKGTGDWMHVPETETCIKGSLNSVEREDGKLIWGSPANLALFEYLRKLEGPHLCGWCHSGEHGRCRRGEAKTFAMICECTCELR